MANRIIGARLLVIAFTFILPFFCWWITRAHFANKFGDGFSYHMNQTLQFEDVDVAVKEIDLAKQYLETHKLTQGCTSIFSCDEEDDIGYLYTFVLKRSVYIHKLQNAHIKDQELLTQLTGMALVKGMITYHSIHEPSGISIYPYNSWYCVWGSVSIVLFILGTLSFFIFLSEKGVLD